MLENRTIKQAQDYSPKKHLTMPFHFMCLYQDLYLLFTGFIIIVLQNMVIWPCQGQRTASRLALSNATPPNAGFQSYVSSVFPDGEHNITPPSRWPFASFGGAPVRTWRVEKSHKTNKGGQERRQHGCLVCKRRAGTVFSVKKLHACIAFVASLCFTISSNIEVVVR